MSDNKNVNNKEKGFVVGGYTFKTKQEAQEAKDEMNAIKYLSGKTDSKDPKQVYVLYNKIIDRQLFYTSIGLNYLKNLQQFLYNSPDIPDDKIKPIPVKSETQAAIDRRRERNEHRSELHTLSIQVAKYKNNYMRIMIVNVFLVIALIAMFFILKTGSNSNVINYEVNVQNKYSSWQTELESKEAKLKEKEKEYIKEKGLDTIEKHAYDFIIQRLAPKEIINDGKQTPMKGHPVFIAQHATATCCRGCLYKWHKIRKGKELTQKEIKYVVDLIMEWIKRQL